jgi:hypothetical protein
MNTWREADAATLGRDISCRKWINYAGFATGAGSPTMY